MTTTAQLTKELKATAAAAGDSIELTSGYFEGTTTKSFGVRINGGETKNHSRTRRFSIIAAQLAYE